MGLFSSIDNSKQINDAYVKKQLNNRDIFTETWFNSHNSQDFDTSPLGNLVEYGKELGWPFRTGFREAPFSFGSLIDPTPNQFDSVQGDEIKEEGVTGLYNYKTPTDSQFAQCMDSQGLSVWDTNGWWRCLFPQNIIRQNLPNLQDMESKMILTRQKVETDVDHKFGLFFTDYTKYLLWKSQMNKIIKDKRSQEEETFKAETNNKAVTHDHNHDNVPDAMTPENIMLSDDSVMNTATKVKNVVGTSEVLRSSMATDGSSEETKEMKTYYDDGSVILRTQKKVTPRDGGAPRVENHERVLRKGRDESSSGFPFWSRKK